MGESCPDKQELQGQLIEILHRISGADPAVITPDARLMEDVGIDSLGFYEILMAADLRRLPPERLALFIDLPHQPVYQRFSWYRGDE